MKGSTFMTQGDPPAHHPAAAATAKYCVQQIEENGGKNKQAHFILWNTVYHVNIAHYFAAAFDVQFDFCIRVLNDKLYCKCVLYNTSIRIG